MLLHSIHNDEQETWFIIYGASLMLTTPTSSTMVWNRCPYWGSFLSLSNSWAGCMSALGVLKHLGYFVPLWSWLLWTRPSLKHLELGSLNIFCVLLSIEEARWSTFSGRTNPSPKKHHSHLYTRYLCVHVWSLGWKGRKRERQRECCVCKVSTHSHEFSDEEESEKDK